MCVCARARAQGYVRFCRRAGSRAGKRKGEVILFDKCMGVSDSCCERSALPPRRLVPLLIRVASLDSIFQLEWDKRGEVGAASVEDGWVELATLLRLKRTPKLAQPELL